GPVVGPQQHLDLPPQVGVPGTGPVQVRGPLGGARFLQRGEKDGLDRGFLGGHGISPVGGPLCNAPNLPEGAPGIPAKSLRVRPTPAAVDGGAQPCPGPFPKLGCGSVRTPPPIACYQLTAAGLELIAARLDPTRAG